MMAFYRKVNNYILPKHIFVIEPESMRLAF